VKHEKIKAQRAEIISLIYSFFSFVFF